MRTPAPFLSRALQMSTVYSWIPSADTTTERYLLPGRRFLIALPAAFSSQVNLLGAKPRESASQISFATGAVLQQS